MVNRDMKQAMRDKRVETRDLLRVVIGEFNREGKEVSDKRANAIIRKMYDNALEFGNPKEVQILGLYLPRQMADALLESIIEEFCKENNITTMKGMGQVMGFLKENYNGAYDGKVAGGLVRELLA